MVRTQIQLTEEQAARLRGEIAAQRISMAEAIREAVELWLASRQAPSREAQEREALSVIGILNSGVSNVAEEHDRYLEEAFAHDSIH